MKNDRKNVFRVKKERDAIIVSHGRLRGVVFLHHKYFYIVLSVYCTRKTSNGYKCLLRIA